MGNFKLTKKYHCITDFCYKLLYKTFINGYTMEILMLSSFYNTFLLIVYNIFKNSKMKNFYAYSSINFPISGRVPFVFQHQIFLIYLVSIMFLALYIIIT